jgi:hypothetical protein
MCKASAIGCQHIADLNVQVAEPCKGLPDELLLLMYRMLCDMYAATARRQPRAVSILALASSLAEIPVPKAATAWHDLVARTNALINLRCYDGNLQVGKLALHNWNSKDGIFVGILILTSPKQGCCPTLGYRRQMLVRPSGAAIRVKNRILPSSTPFSSSTC